jgi:hypothetical protein
MEHTPIRVWQEKQGEISWLCSCGCHNKHFPLPANLECGMKYVDRPLVQPPTHLYSLCVESEYRRVKIS